MFRGLFEQLNCGGPTLCGGTFLDIRPPLLILLACFRTLLHLDAWRASSIEFWIPQGSMPHRSGIVPLRSTTFRTSFRTSFRKPHIVPRSFHYVPLRSANSWHPAPSGNRFWPPETFPRSRVQNRQIIINWFVSLSEITNLEKQSNCPKAKMDLVSKITNFDAKISP